MKRFLVIFVLIVILSITACKNEQNEIKTNLSTNSNASTRHQDNQGKNISSETIMTNDGNHDTISKSFSGCGIYDMSGAFLNMVNSNPIDRDYEVEFKKFNESPTFNTKSYMDFENKYLAIWDAELNSVYRRLLSMLDQDQQKLLIDSQKSWLQYHTKEPEFVKKVFCQQENGPLFGTQGSVQILQAQRYRIRKRTLELMEYVFLLSGNIQFEYKKDE